jgi:hypothetical protein
MLRVVSACIAVIAGFAASSALAQSYPSDDGYGGGDYGGGAPALILPDGYGAPDSSHDSYGSSEAAPADIVAPDGAPDGEESHEGDEGGH